MDKDTRFLIVDDFSTMRKIIKKTLVELGYTSVEEAANGVQAWEMIEAKKKENSPYQFIISDWNMPEMSGLDLLKKFKADPVNKQVPFLMATAESEQSQIVEAIKSGCDDYVVKPFSPQIIKDKIAKVHEKYSKKAA